MSQLSVIKEQIKKDPMNIEYTRRGVEPLYCADPSSRLLIIGQAPGRIAEQTQLFWNDPSGDRLRSWMGIDRKTFYDSTQIAVLPMDFYFPGRGPHGDYPPRKKFAEKWHPALIQLMPNIKLTLLIGQYACAMYLKKDETVNLTDKVKHYQHFLPTYFPLVHPSPRNQIWLKKNPWFGENVIPELKIQVNRALYD